jgi:uncharacterized protein (DUF58 family)
MEGTLDPLGALDSRQFLLAVKKLADSFSYGTDRSPFLGSGIEFVQSRPYQWGDPVRSIDWRVTARSGRLFVKEYEAPKRMPCYLLVDTSASMTVSSTRKSKYAVAVQLAGGLALACLDRISPVGVVGVGARDLRVEPSLSKHQILQWLIKLRRYRFDEATLLGRRIAELGPSLTCRVMVIVLSDLFDPNGLAALKKLAQKHDVAVLQLSDPAESGLRGAGVFRAREAETGKSFVAHGRRQWLDQQSIDDVLKRAGIDHLRIVTDRPFVHRLRHFLRSRGLLGRGAR